MSMTATLVTEDVENGGKAPNDTIIHDFAYANNVINANKQIRLAFIRKVYSLLSVQLILTISVACVFMYTDPIKDFVQTSDWMWISSIFLTIITLFPLYIFRHTTPWNFILLIAFTICEAYSIGVVVTLCDQWSVLLAFGLTCVIFGSLTLFTCQSKYDFSAWHGGLYTGLTVLIVCSILEIFFFSYTSSILISGAGAFLFSLFIIYDTHILMKRLSPEEYILATINLYLDVINLFLHLLRIIQGGRN